MDENYLRLLEDKINHLETNLERLEKRNSSNESSIAVLVFLFLLLFGIVVFLILRYGIPMYELYDDMIKLFK